MRTVLNDEVRLTEYQIRIRFDLQVSNNETYIIRHCVSLRYEKRPLAKYQNDNVLTKIYL